MRDGRSGILGRGHCRAGTPLGKSGKQLGQPNWATGGATIPDESRERGSVWA